jgi:hypothetical protein
MNMHSHIHSLFILHHMNDDCNRKMKTRPVFFWKKKRSFGGFSQPAAKVPADTALFICVAGVSE